VSNLVTIAILQSLVVGCLSLLFSIIHHYRILCHNELKFVTHIFQIFGGVNAHLIYWLCKLGLFWFFFKSYRSLLYRYKWFKFYKTEKSDTIWVLTYFDLHVSTFCGNFWSLKMKTRRAITWLMDTVNHWFLISMVTELYLK
jgi:hypothetical protein